MPPLPSIVCFLKTLFIVNLISQFYLDLDEDGATQTKVKSVILKVSKWKALAHGLGLSEHIEKVQRIEDELQRIMIKLGARLEEPGPRAKSSSYTQIKLTSLN